MGSKHTGSELDLSINGTINIGATSVSTKFFGFALEVSPGKYSLMLSAIEIGGKKKRLSGTLIDIPISQAIAERVGIYRLKGGR